MVPHMHRNFKKMKTLLCKTINSQPKTLLELKDISNVNVRDWPFELSPPYDIYRAARFTAPTNGKDENIDS
jgi:hypothetical protein